MKGAQPECDSIVPFINLGTPPRTDVDVAFRIRATLLSINLNSHVAALQFLTAYQ